MKRGVPLSSAEEPVASFNHQLIVAKVAGRDHQSSTISTIRGLFSGGGWARHATKERIQGQPLKNINKKTRETVHNISKSHSYMATEKLGRNTSYMLPTINTDYHYDRPKLTNAINDKHAVRMPQLIKLTQIEIRCAKPMLKNVY